jgi:hypothetical protein
MIPAARTTPRRFDDGSARRFSRAALVITSVVACGRADDPAGPAATETGASGGSDSAGMGAPPAPGAAGAPNGSSAVAEYRSPPADDVLGTGALAVLRSRCESCHGETGSSTIGWVLDVPELIARGSLVPGSSATSPLVQVLVEGHQSVPASYTRVYSTTGEAELVARYVDGLLPVDPGCVALPFVDMDQAFAAMAADIAELPAGARPFARYVGLTHATNAGVCGVELERQRRALFQAVNAVSNAETISLPEPLDASGVLYRIDLRNYGWNRDVGIAGDGWLAIATVAGPYALRYSGPDADLLSTETGARVPFLPANALVHAVADGDLYFALLAIGLEMEAHRATLGVATQPMLAEPEAGLSWIGFASTGSEVEVVRAPQSRAERAYWVLQRQYTNDSESVFDSPFGDGSPYPYQLLFGLPNGMLGYALEDPYTLTRLNGAPSHLACQECELPPIGPAACSACHAAGLFSLSNQVPAWIAANAAAFDRETAEDVRTHYPLQNELDALIQADDAVHEQALQELGVPKNEPDPLSRAYHRFELDPLDARHAAAELGVTVDVLRASLSELPAGLEPLGNGTTVDRATFTARFAAAACAVRRAGSHRPADCE